MTTILEPAGSSTPYYNKDGTTVSAITIDMTAPGIQNIPAASTKTILIATVLGSAAPDRGIRLQANADVGDVVEIYASSIPQYITHAPVGETILQIDGTTASFRTLRGPNRFTKVAPTTWGVFGGAFA